MAFQLSGLVFSIIRRTPLYGKIKASAFAKMRVSTESTGVDWDAEVAALQDVCVDASLAAVKQEAGESFVTPAYYRRAFHAYDDGNLCWEHACHQPLVSRAVGARNLPGLPAEDGDANFRGAFERELLALLPADAPCRQPGAAIVDLGCGTGISTRRLLDAFPGAASCVGVDLSPHMVAVGRALLDREEGASDPRLKLALGDAARLGDVPDGSVDLVSLCLVLHELPGSATDDILSEAARALKPGGHLAIFEMDPRRPASCARAPTRGSSPRCAPPSPTSTTTFGTWRPCCAAGCRSAASRCWASDSSSPTSIRWWSRAECERPRARRSRATCVARAGRSRARAPRVCACKKLR